MWEWRSWDHLIQDHDKTKPGFGEVSEHPELFDLNYMGGEEDPVAKTKANTKTTATKDDPKQGQAPAVRKNPDWMHVNAVAYNADLDQIALSSPNFSEIWIIDHSTTTAEAKGHTGGRTRQRRRYPLPLGQPTSLQERYEQRSSPLLPAQHPVDCQRAPRHRPLARLQ